MHLTGKNTKTDETNCIYFWESQLKRHLDILEHVQEVTRMEKGHKTMSYKEVWRWLAWRRKKRSKNKMVSRYLNSSHLAGHLLSTYSASIYWLPSMSCVKCWEYNVEENRHSLSLTEVYQRESDNQLIWKK